MLEYETAINAEMPRTLVLTRDRHDSSQARAIHAKVIKARFIERSLNNFARLRRDTPPYPSLAPMSWAIFDALSRQIASLRAAQSYLETGDVAKLKGPGGVLEQGAFAKKDAQFVPGAASEFRGRG